MNLEEAKHAFLALFPESLREVVREHGYIAGGAIASTVRKEKPNDFDVYFDDERSAAQVCRFLLRGYSPFMECYDNNVSGFRLEYANGRVFVENPSELVEFASPVTLGVVGGFQVITAFVGVPTLVVEKFDFLHTQAYSRFLNDGITFKSVEVRDAAVNKHLIYTGSDYPIASLFRLRKFIRRGWRVTAGEMLKVAIDVNGADIADIDTLARHLTGVDIVVFQAVIEALRSRPETRKDKKQLFALIDSVFQKDQKEENNDGDN